MIESVKKPASFWLLVGVENAVGMDSGVWREAVAFFWASNQTRNKASVTYAVFQKIVLCPICALANIPEMRMIFMDPSVKYLRTLLKHCFLILNIQEMTIK